MANQYKGRCAGRLIEFLDLYAGVRVAYECIFSYDSQTGGGSIKFWGPWATYTWDGESDIPTFVFLQDESGDLAWKQYVYKPFFHDEALALDISSLRYNNLNYTIQEISKLPEITKEASLNLATMYLHGWTKEFCEKHLEHLMDCSKKRRRWLEARKQEIERNGYAEDTAIDLS